MGLLAGIVKDYLVPGSVSFLIFAFAVGVALLYGGERLRRLGRAWLTVLAFLYWALSAWLVSDALSAGLVSGYRGLATAADARGATTIVVLSVGSTAYGVNGREVPELGKDTAFNVLEAARVYRLLKQPWIVASGGPGDPGRPRTPDSEMMRDAMVKLGVPAERILLESKSANTREQAAFTSDLLRARGVTAIVLVTAPEHMHRAVGTFEALGFSVIPSVSAFKSPERGTLWERLRPSRGALLQSDWAVYEYMARVYYWLQGWLEGFGSPPGPRWSLSRTGAACMMSDGAGPAAPYEGESSNDQSHTPVCRGGLHARRPCRRSRGRAGPRRARAAEHHPPQLQRAAARPHGQPRSGRARGARR